MHFFNEEHITLKRHSIATHYQYFVITFSCSDSKIGLDTILSTRGCGMVCIDNKVRPVINAVMVFLNRVLNKMKHMHYQLKKMPLCLHAEVGGSTADGTTVGLPDEYDCRIVIDDLVGFVEVAAEREISLTLKVNGDEIMIKYHPLLDFIGQVGHILLKELYSYLYELMCKALSDQESYKGLPLCWKHITKEQVHLEWRGDDFLMMALKIDVVFIAKTTRWYPCQGRQKSCLLPRPSKKYEVRLLVGYMMD